MCKSKVFLNNHVFVYMIPVQVLDTGPRGNETVGLNHFLCISTKIQLKYSNASDATYMDALDNMILFCQMCRLGSD